MGCAASDEDPVVAEQAVQASELLTLTVLRSGDVQQTELEVAGAVLEVQARALDSVGTLLNLAAVALGIEQSRSQDLQLECQGAVVKDRAQTLRAVGLKQHSRVTLIESGKLRGMRLDIMEAVGAGRLEDVELAIQFDEMRVLHSDPDGRTALHKAAAADDLEMVRLLLNHSSVVNAQDNHGDIPLHLARGSVAGLILERGGDYKAKNHAGRTPLHMAASNNDPEMVGLLLNMRCDPNMKDNEGNVALHDTSPESAQLLLQTNANPNILNNEGESVMDKYVFRPDMLPIMHRHGVVDIRSRLREPVSIHRQGMFD